MIHINFNSTLVDNLFEIAKSNNPVGRARVTAAIVHRDFHSPFVATNVNKTHPFQKKYGRNCDSIFLHAEINATIKALRYLKTTDFSQADLYIVRAKMDNKRRWEFGIARPCKGCVKCIEEFKFKNVFYSDEPNMMQRFAA